MDADRSESEHLTFWNGAMLGGAQAHAIAGPILAVVALLTGHRFLALTFLIGAVIGWWIWWVINRLHLRPDAHTGSRPGGER